MRILILLTLLMAYGQVFSQEKGKAVFEKNSFDFGDVKEEGGPVEATFVFKNEGKAPLQLTFVQASCGCTTPSWSQDPIAPGGTGFVKASYNPDNRPGKFSKTITVRTDGEPQAMVLIISGNVLPRVKGVKDHYPVEMGNMRFSSSYVYFGDVKKGGNMSKTLTVYNQGTQPIEIRPEKSKLPAHLSMQITKFMVLPKDSSILTFRFEEAKLNDWGYVYSSFDLFTTDTDKAEKKLGFSAKIVENFDALPKGAPMPKVSFNKEKYDFDTVYQNQTVKTVFTITNYGASVLYIRKTKASCGCTVPNLPKMELRPGESMPIEVAFSTGTRSGKQQKSITVLCNDPNKQETILWIEANVQPAKQ
jgi:hypothetical protein